MAKQRPPRATAERVREALTYNPENGEFRWREGIKGRAPDQLAGWRRDRLYPVLMLDARLYQCGMIAHVIVTGEWPKRQIRFANGDPTDTRWENIGYSGFPDTPKGRRDYKRHLIYMRAYGLGLPEYDRLFAAQQGKCAICGGTQIVKNGTEMARLEWDHDHETGLPRELLCSPCNTALGLVNESEETLLAAIRYLRKHRPAERLRA